MVTYTVVQVRLALRLRLIMTQSFIEGSSMNWGKGSSESIVWGHRSSNDATRRLATHYVGLINVYDTCYLRSTDLWSRPRPKSSNWYGRLLTIFMWTLVPRMVEVQNFIANKTGPWVANLSASFSLCFIFPEFFLDFFIVASVILIFPFTHIFFCL